MKAVIQYPDFSPDVFSVSLFGLDLALRWYALAYIAGILIGWRLVLSVIKRADLWKNNTPPMDRQQIEDLLTWVILGVILGGRLGFVLFYQPAYYLANPSQILMVWQGGMAFHGGFLGVCLALFLFCRKYKIPLLPAADMMALGVPPGLLLGRIANFVNAELWGRATDLPWAVIFPGPYAQDCGQTEGLLCARHPSQLYEAGLEGLLLGLVLMCLVFARHVLKSPGFVTGVFFAGYGLARFSVEFVRQPDAQFVTDGNALGLALQLGGYGLTMGQLLSLPMILVGVVLMLRARSEARVA
jgi:phosphatidylglycerol:prolipoprotein diacylglycerol transferase